MKKQFKRQKTKFFIVTKVYELDERSGKYKLLSETLKNTNREIHESDEPTSQDWSERVTGEIRAKRLAR